jgi:hypothetical protein
MPPSTLIRRREQHVRVEEDSISEPPIFVVTQLLWPPTDRLAT